MNTLKQLAVLALVASVLVMAPAGAQAAVTSHSILSANVAIGAKVVQVQTVTNITANTTTLVINHEGMLVLSVSGSAVTVQRGYNTTFETAHTSGDVVLIVPLANLSSRDRYGACTASQEPYLPVVSINRTARDVKMYDCPNGTWVPVPLPGDSPVMFTQQCTVPGMDLFTILTSFTSTTAMTFGNDTTPVSGTQYFGTFVANATQRLTGLSLKNGTVASTDLIVLTLYRADGTALVSTPLAGVTATGANRFQQIAFDTPFMLYGGERYWLGAQFNGTTERFSTIPSPISNAAGAFMGQLGSSFTGTFGTIANLTASAAASSPGTTALPTTLIANTAPLMCGY